MKSYQQRTYYELLGLHVNASVDEIRLAYQRISELDDAACLKSYQLENASDLLKLRELLCEAVEFLSDPEIRVEYDRSLTLAAAESAEPNNAETVQLDGVESVATIALLDGGAETAECKPVAAAEHDQSETIQLDGVESAERNPATTVQLDGAASSGGDRGENTEPDVVSPERIHPEKAQGTHPDLTQHRDRDRTETIALDAAASAEPARAETAERDTTKGGKVREAARAERDPLPEPAQLSFPDIFARESILRQPPPLPVVSYAPRSTPVDAFREDGASSSRLAEAGPRQPHGNLDNAPVLAEESALASAEAALALVSARVQQFRRPLEISADAEFNGELLRRVRESQGLALQQLCERTRVSIKHLENIEADRYGALPATVYLRGILISLARELKLDPVRVARSYIAAATVAREGQERRSD